MLVYKFQVNEVLNSIFRLQIEDSYVKNSISKSGIKLTTKTKNGSNILFYNEIVFVNDGKTILLSLVKTQENKRLVEELVKELKVDHNTVTQVHANYIYCSNLDQATFKVFDLGDEPKTLLEESYPTGVTKTRSELNNLVYTLIYGTL
jgi:hypothetical protein